MPLFRRLGIRTQAEIEAERQALLVVRGDYQGAGSRFSVEQALQAVTGAFADRNGGLPLGRG